MIVKVQIALASTGPKQHKGRGLVYEEGRGHLVEQALPDAVVRALKGEPKGFFHADWAGSVWRIGAKADWQTW
jgi:hypothetical protein